MPSIEILSQLKIKKPPVDPENVVTKHYFEDILKQVEESTDEKDEELRSVIKEIKAALEWGTF